jgi:hypothetical protein
MAKKLKDAIGEQLEQGKTLHMAGVSIGRSPIEHVRTVYEFCEGLRAAIKQCRDEGHDTVTASNDCVAWESVLRSIEIANGALSAVVIEKRRS